MSFLNPVLAIVATICATSALGSTPLLPASAAREAAVAALESCERNGHRVSVTVVDASGLTRVVLRGDGATPHTLDSSRSKAYTAATFGPITDMSLTSEIAQRLLASPETQQLGNLPNIILLAGGTTLRIGRDVVGGLGVAGAPGGTLDEACALAGAQRLSEGRKQP